MTKQHFLDRMSNAYDMGLCEPRILQLAEQWCDAIMRLEGGQFYNFMATMEQEKERTDFFSTYKTLANDVDGYKVIQLMAILTHPCQECATDPGAWHTRSGFCPHKDTTSDVFESKDALRDKGNL